MKIEYLHEFTTIARLKSFSQAADELYMTQSSLSKHIKSLEKELGVLLFDRSTRNVTLSNIGQDILTYSKSIYHTQQDLFNTVEHYKNSGKQSINIASIPVMAQYDITGAITRFKVKYPYVNQSIQTMEGCDINRSLESRRSDLAFQRTMDGSKDYLEYLPFVTDQLMVLLQSSHPLSEKTHLHLLDVSEENFMFLDKGTMLYNLCYNTCLKAGFIPNISYTGKRPENLIEMVRSGMGIALLMKRLTIYYKQDGIACIPVSPLIESTIYLTRLKHHKHTPAAELFWRFIEEQNK